MIATGKETAIRGRLQRERGFTLIELMIAVVVIGILAAIAYPSYTQYATKAKRSAAESFIMGVSNKQEQYMLDARAYATTLTALGVTTPPDVSTNYNIAITNVGATPPTYTITATPIGTQLTQDTKCGSVSITQAGVKSASTGATNCW